MDKCKNIQCCYRDDEDNTLCPFCGYCYSCHVNTWNYDDTCASKLITEETEKFNNGNIDFGKVKTFVCKDCGTDKFIVGYTDSYETSIKCPNCNYHMVVHDG